MVILLMYGCNSESSDWEETQQADTYEAYQAYIEEHPEGEHVEEARSLAEQHIGSQSAMIQQLPLFTPI